MLSQCKQAVQYFAEKTKTQQCFELVLLKWPIFEEISNVLKVLYEITIDVQHANFTLSDFYGSWLKMERGLQKLVAASPFAQAMIKELEKRKKVLLNNQALISAVYLDPRYNFKLTAEEVQIAKMALQSLHERLKKQNKSTLQSNSVTHGEDDSFEEDCVASGMTRAIRSGITAPAPENICIDTSFTDLFESFDQCVRLHHKDSILEFWHDRRNEDPALYELASIIHAIPPTQATVERAFSALGLVCNNKTSRLSETSLENILMVVLNKNLIDPINERDIDALATNAL